MISNSLGPSVTCYLTRAKNVDFLKFQRGTLKASPQDAVGVRVRKVGSMASSSTGYLSRGKLKAMLCELFAAISQRTCHVPLEGTVLNATVVYTDEPGKPRLHSEFQDSLDCIHRRCLRKQ